MTVKDDLLVMDSADLYIYDENGKLIETLDDVQKFKTENKRKLTEIIFQKALLSKNLMAFMGDVEEENDFSKDVRGSQIKINYGAEGQDKKVKIIAKTLAYNPNTHEVKHHVRITFPNGLIRKSAEFDLEAGRAFSPTYNMFALPFDEDGNTMTVEFIDL